MDIKNECSIIYYYCLVNRFRKLANSNKALYAIFAIS